jgi:hypothetical protein
VQDAGVERPAVVSNFRSGSGPAHSSHLVKLLCLAVYALFNGLLLCCLAVSCIAGPAWGYRQLPPMHTAWSTLKVTGCQASLWMYWGTWWWCRCVDIEDIHMWHLQVIPFCAIRASKAVFATVWLQTPTNCSYHTMVCASCMPCATHSLTHCPLLTLHICSTAAAAVSPVQLGLRGTRTPSFSCCRGTQAAAGSSGGRQLVS